MRLLKRLVQFAGSFPMIVMLRQTASIIKGLEVQLLPPGIVYSAMRRQESRMCMI